MSAGQPLRIGIAGLGIAASYTLPVFAAHPDTEVAAAADARPEALEKFAREYEGETFQSIRAMCASPIVDVIYVATPNFLHAEHAVLAAENRKHLIVEKPLAISLEECEAIVGAVERNGVQLICGHTHSFNPPIHAIRHIVRRGDLGRLTMLHTWNYTDLLYRPRAAWEMDTTRGGGVVWIQAPHQVDMVRLISGGLVRSVRAMTGAWDDDRPTEGAFTAYLELEDGTPATLVYSGYGYFDTGELHHWVGERGQPRDPSTNAKSHSGYGSRLTENANADEETLRDARRYGGVQDRSPQPGTRPEHQQFFGLLLVSCQRGDLRQSPDGLYQYDATGRHELAVPLEPTGAYRMIDELRDAIQGRRAPTHDGRWGMATVEVCLAILQSARERREITLSHQVPTRD